MEPGWISEQEATGIAQCKTRILMSEYSTHFASSYRSMSLSALYQQHESRKKNEYGSRVREIEHGCFMPLVFSTTGGMGHEAAIVLKRLAEMISNKTGDNYSTVMGWLGTRLSFALLRSALACLRSARARPSDIKNDISIAIASAEGNIRN